MFGRVYSVEWQRCSYVEHPTHWPKTAFVYGPRPCIYMSPRPGQCGARTGAYNRAVAASLGAVVSRACVCGTTSACCASIHRALDFPLAVAEVTSARDTHLASLNREMDGGTRTDN